MKRRVYFLLSMVICNYFSYSQDGAIYYGSEGKYAQANGFDFNNGKEGIIMEHQYGESAGIYINDNTIIIWNPGDGNRLLSVYDEDFMTGSNYEKFYIDGDGDFFKASDERVKENIQNVSNSLDKLKSIRGVNYNFKKPIEPHEKIHKVKMHAGFIAQELEAQFPEIVDTDTLGNKFVNYEGLIPYLVEAIKEQQQLIESLSEKMKESKDKTSNARLAEEESEEVLIAELFQNKPNPFNQETTIPYILPESANNARLYIYNMQGNQLLSFSISDRGAGKLVLQGAQLSAGMYMYTLIVDGVEVDTKKMILTR